MNFQKNKIWVECVLIFDDISEDVIEYLDWSNLKEMFQNKTIKEANLFKPILRFHGNRFTQHEFNEYISNQWKVIDASNFEEMIGYTPDWRSKLKPVEKKQIRIYAEGYHPMLRDTRGT